MFFAVGNGFCEKDPTTKSRKPKDELTPEIMLKFFKQNKLGKTNSQQLQYFYQKYLVDIKQMDFETF